MDPTKLTAQITSPWMEQRQVLGPYLYVGFGPSETSGLRTPDESEESDGIGISIYEPVPNYDSDSSRMDVDSIS